MDYVVHAADQLFLNDVYPKTWPAEDPVRQFITLFVIVNVTGALMYLSMATFSYYFIFDHEVMKHPKFLKNQVRREINCALSAVPGMAIPTCLLFVAELQGYSKLYDTPTEENGGYTFLAVSVVTFFLFTDCIIYWIHRYLHHPLIYKTLHKAHHTWKVPSPFASHAFHPVDGFLQSLPYHIYPFLFPLHKGLYLGLFFAVNVWTVLIHDADYRVPKVLRPIVNGSAHHTDHHLFFTCNYGEYLTLWDRIGGSFKDPTAYHGCGVHDDLAKINKGQALKFEPDVDDLLDAADAAAAANTSTDDGTSTTATARVKKMK